MILVLTTTDKKSLAQEIGKALLKEKLVACASILPMESSYWWPAQSNSQLELSMNNSEKAKAKNRSGKGKITNAKEFQLILKTKEENFAKVEKVIKALHTYELPEVISIKIENAGAEYTKWLNSAVK